MKVHLPTKPIADPLECTIMDLRYRLAVLDSKQNLTNDEYIEREASIKAIKFRECGWKGSRRIPKSMEEYREKWLCYDGG